ncbi:MAG: YiiX/YebB-like N1pC/P60 family cysteine hydrolase [Bacteroidales bacterium]
MKTFKRLLWLLVILFVVAVIYSLLFPGKIRIVDNMRMLVQKPLIKWAGQIKMSQLTFSGSDENDGNTDISLEELKTIVKDLPAGSVFFTQTRNYPLNEFIPGEWKHTGIFLGTKDQIAGQINTSGRLYKALDTLMNQTDVYVLDSYAEGVSIHPIQELSNMKEKSYLTHFAAFSFNWDPRQIEMFIENALIYTGRDYDYDWITENTQSIYCSELLYHTLKDVGINISDRTKTISRDIFTPDNLYRYLTLHSGKRKAFSFYGLFHKR